MKQYHTSENSNNQNSWPPDARSPERRRYDAALEARARFYEGTGAAESESWQAAADDLGSFEQQQWIAQFRCNCPGCVRHIEALERINRTLAVEVDRLQAQLKAAALHGRDRRAA
jgi:hypothetical protein